MDNRELVKCLPGAVGHFVSLEEKSGHLAGVLMMIIRQLAGVAVLWHPQRLANIDFLGRQKHRNNSAML